MTKQIPVRKLGITHFAIVDDDDFERISKYTWRLDGEGYAMSQERINGIKKVIMMHRVINKTLQGFYTDHINHDRLDNRKSNLRTVTSSMNQQNSVQSLKHGLHGIYVDKRDGLWRARLKVNGITRKLGSFKTKEEAHAEYKKFANIRSDSKFIIVGGCCNE